MKMGKMGKEDGENKHTASRQRLTLHAGNV